MPLSLEYWINVWDNRQRALIRPDSDIYEGKQIYPGITLHLLSEYAAYSKSLMTLGWHKNVVGSSFHFFSKRKGDKYTRQVIDVIENFYHPDAIYTHNPRYNTVVFILACIKNIMGNTPLDPNDNLAIILNVIHIKTNVNYARLNTNRILNRYLRNIAPSETPPQLNLSTANEESTIRNGITPSLNRYLESFNNNDFSFSDAFERLDIVNINAHYTCPVSLNIVNQPVRIDGILFDFCSLLALPLNENGSRKNPITQECFYLDQIQPDRRCKAEIETLIKQYELAPSYTGGSKL